MELRHCRALIAVADELHFGRAAKRLHLTQPPVSLAIKELETELGLRLFDRSSRQIALTPAGADVLVNAKAVIAATDRLSTHAKQATDLEAAPISIGFISLAAYSFLPSAINRFTTDFPKVQITLIESTSDRMLVNVESGEIDIGCILLPPSLSKALQYQATNRDSMVIALPESHPLAKNSSLRLEQLANERFLCFERHVGPLMYDTMISSCVRHGFSPKTFLATQMHTIVSMVAGGVGVAMIPKCVEVLHREGVVYRSIKGERTKVETGVVWKKQGAKKIVSLFQSYLPKIK